MMNIPVERAWSAFRPERFLNLACRFRNALAPLWSSKLSTSYLRRKLEASSRVQPVQRLKTKRPRRPCHRATNDLVRRSLLTAEVQVGSYSSPESCPESLPPSLRFSSLLEVPGASPMCASKLVQMAWWGDASTQQPEALEIRRRRL